MFEMYYGCPPDELEVQKQNVVWELRNQYIRERHICCDYKNNVVAVTVHLEADAERGCRALPQRKYGQVNLYNEENGKVYTNG